MLGGGSDRDLARDLGPRRLPSGAAASDGLEAHRLVLHVNRAHERAALRPVDEVSDVRRRLRTSFNQPLNKWNVSKVRDMNGMFMKASSFNQPFHAPWYSS